MRNEVGLLCERRVLCRCILASYWTAVFEGFFCHSRLPPIGWRNMFAEKMSNTPLATLSEPLAARLSTFIMGYNYTQLVIVLDDKNKPLL